MRHRRIIGSTLLILGLLAAASAHTARAAGSCSDLSTPLQNLAGCNFNHASLTARLALAGSNLQGANLNQALISGEAALLGSNLAGANLNHAQVSAQDALIQADLAQANLNQSRFSAAAIGVAANLQGANLNQAQIGGLGDFTAANLQGANLNQAVLSGTGALTGADVRGANLRGVTVSGLDALKYARYGNTTCPDGSNSDQDGGTCAGHLSAAGHAGTMDTDAVLTWESADAVPCPSCGGGGAPPPPPPGNAPPPGAVLGGLNLDAYCGGYSHVPGIGAPGTNVEFGPNQAFKWDCVNAAGTSGSPINMQAACNATYGPNALAFVENPNDAYSWVCVSAPTGSYFETFDGNTYLALGDGGGSGGLPDFVFLGADGTLALGGGGGSGGLPDFVYVPSDGSSVTYSTPNGGFDVAESGSLANGGAV